MVSEVTGNNHGEAQGGQRRWLVSAMLINLVTIDQICRTAADP